MLTRDLFSVANFLFLFWLLNEYPTLKSINWHYVHPKTYFGTMFFLGHFAQVVNWSHFIAEPRFIDEFNSEVNSTVVYDSSPRITQRTGNVVI